MQAKLSKVTSFGRTKTLKVPVFRPERQSDIPKLTSLPASNLTSLLGVGNRLSYGDSCLNEQLISSERLNRFVYYDNKTQQLTVEPGVTFYDILRLKTDCLPLVLPGTLHATIAGGVANDIHGKNQSQYGCFGHHINWLELALPYQTIRISPNSHPDLFYASIGGLGLTGFIRKINMTLAPKSQAVKSTHSCFKDIVHGIRMLISNQGKADYAAAWFDPYRKGRGVLYQASHTYNPVEAKPLKNYRIPFTPPISVINQTSMKYFNQLLYKHCLKTKQAQKQDIVAFNNPLDSINGWNRLYGKKGLYQFQCVIPTDKATNYSHHLFELLQQYQASPSLAVFKLFNQDGLGLLSFAKPGVTFAIDFPATQTNAKCIQALNQSVLDYDGRVYLAKDSLLNPEQFCSMYPKKDQFIEVLKTYELYDTIRSSMSMRLGIHL